MFNEDNNGFVYFPMNGSRISINIGHKTLVYFISFETKNISNISNLRLELPGDFVSDNILERSNYINQSDYEYNYFPNLNSEDANMRMISIPIVSSICVGWNDNSYEIDGYPWKATFHDLTEDGKRLYYTIKKLHNNKELRILTFNNI